MKIWLSKNSEVPVREQLVAQITLGIASGELAVGTRLPSTREIALRCKIHSNTVSHAYRQLAERGWLEFRHGSGFYVRAAPPAAAEAGTLDALIADFLRAAHERGFTNAAIRARLARFLDAGQAGRLYVIENDPALGAILVEELRAATALEVAAANVDALDALLANERAHFAAMFDERAKLGARLPADRGCVFLKARSAAAAMTGETRPAPDELIAVVSGWENFLVLARIMLVAARVAPESLLVRSTRAPEWRRGLAAARMVICDTVTAKSLGDHPNVRAFRLVADESLAEIARLR